MTLFREHRASYEESMATVMEVESLAELKKVLIEKDIGFVIGPLNTLPYGGIDERNDWDTWIVMCSGSVLGFSDGELK